MSKPLKLLLIKGTIASPAIDFCSFATRVHALSPNWHPERRFPEALHIDCYAKASHPVKMASLEAFDFAEQPTFYRGVAYIFQLLLICRQVLEEHRPRSLYGGRQPERTCWSQYAENIIIAAGRTQDSRIDITQSMSGDLSPDISTQGEEENLRHHNNEQYLHIFRCLSHK